MPYIKAYTFLTDYFANLTRSKSSINVPKTINQCVKLNKSRPRPSSIRPRASTTSGLLINDAVVPSSKKTHSHKRISSTPKPANPDKQTEPRSSNSPFKSVSNNSFDSDDKDSIDNSKNSHFIPSDASTTGSIKSTKIVKNEEEENASFLLPAVQKVNSLRMNINLMSSTEKVNQLKENKNLIYQTGFKSSTSSFIDHEDDDMNFEDSLQEDSFDSDR